MLNWLFGKKDSQHYNIVNEYACGCVLNIRNTISVNGENTKVIDHCPYHNKGNNLLEKLILTDQKLNQLITKDGKIFSYNGKPPNYITKASKDIMNLIPTGDDIND
mgnify:CR=1 FL=1